MTTVAVLADPPRPGTVLTGLVDRDVLDAEEAADLYTAMLCDVCVAIERSGGELLVNYRNPEGESDSADAVEESVESAVSPVLESPESARFEVQVGSSPSARVGNTVTHLLEREEVQSAAVVDPTAALLERRHIDSGAMKLRQAPVVVGPSYGGRLWYAAFTEPIDFTNSFESPALESVTERGASAELDVDFLETLPVVERPEDLASALVEIRARERAGKITPAYTSAVLSDIGLGVEATPDGLTITRETDRS